MRFFLISENFKFPVRMSDKFPFKIIWNQSPNCKIMYLKTGVFLEFLKI
jgi:hypothetical protein